MFSLNDSQKSVIVEALIDLAHDVKQPDQTWANLFDYKVADVAEGRVYLEKILKNASEFDDISWILDFCDDIVDDNQYGSWRQIKARSLWNYIVRNCLFKNHRYHY